MGTVTASSLKKRDFNGKKLFLDKQFARTRFNQLNYEGRSDVSSETEFISLKPIVYVTGEIFHEEICKNYPGGNQRYPV